MTPEEYYKTEFEKDYNLMKDIADAKLYSLNSMFQFAELYHKAEVKNLNIPSVSKSFDCDMCQDDGVLITGMDCTCAKARK